LVAKNRVNALFRYGKKTKIPIIAAPKQATSTAPAEISFKLEGLTFQTLALFLLFSPQRKMGSGAFSVISQFLLKNQS